MMLRPGAEMEGMNTDSAIAEYPQMPSGVFHPGIHNHLFIHGKFKRLMMA
jgi:hypothetical protein